jgi:hypothetical protein
MARGTGGWSAGRYEGRAESDCWLQNDLNLHLIPRGKKLKVCTRLDLDFQKSNIGDMKGVMNVSGCYIRNLIVKQF